MFSCKIKRANVQFPLCWMEQKQRTAISSTFNANPTLSTDFKSKSEYVNFQLNDCSSLLRWRICMQLPSVINKAVWFVNIECVKRITYVVTSFWIYITMFSHHQNQNKKEKTKLTTKLQTPQQFFSVLKEFTEFTKYSHLTRKQARCVFFLFGCNIELMVIYFQWTKPKYIGDVI